MRGDASAVPAPVKSSVNTPSANTAAVVTLAAASGVSHILRRVIWSYNIAPAGGRLVITHTSGSTAIVDVDITECQMMGSLDLGDVPAPVGEDVVVTLAAGGAGCSGKVTLIYQ